jgi:hypothetical protein
MGRHERIGAIWVVAAAALASGCAPGEPPRQRTDAPAGLALRFEDVPTPAAFSWTGPAVADAPGGAAGFWAVAPGLPRPERGRIERLDGAASVDVALFAGRGGALRVSTEAAEALGLGDAAARVRVTALRREPRLAPP